MSELIDACVGNTVLFIVAHHDDEVLFCGGLLALLSGTCRLIILCVHDYYKNRPNAEGWLTAFNNINTVIHAGLISGPFESNKQSPPIGTYANLFKNYNKIREFIKNKINEINPTVIISHNCLGEYGHIDHIIVHSAVMSERGDIRLYCFGNGLDSFTEKIKYKVESKKKLVDLYSDVWNPIKKGYNFVYRGETYIKIP
jgi:hypothetical protein